MSPDEYCQKKAAGSGSSFTHTFVFLPEGQRRAITALYAFCREIDDIVDEAGDPAISQARLDWWRTEVDSIFHGGAQHPVARALAAVREEASLDADILHEIIDGMQMDLDGIVYTTMEELLVYCWRAAGTVGVLSAGIFGYEHPGTREYAKTLGIAFQLTNIIRDVGEDAARGRVYLAAEDLERHGVRRLDMEANHTGEGLRALLDDYGRRTEEYYTHAYALLPDPDRYRQRVGLMMAAIYERLLCKMRQRGYRVLERRATIHPFGKLWIAWRTGVREERRLRARGRT